MDLHHCGKAGFAQLAEAISNDELNAENFVTWEYDLETRWDDGTKLKEEFQNYIFERAEKDDAFAAKLAKFSVAKIVEAVQHPNADKLRVCQVDTKDGRLEIVCGAPNARAGLTTIYAPIGAYVPGSGITLEARPVRGVVSNGMLCSAKELEVAEESDGILELADDLAVGTPAAEAFGLEAVIDFEVTPNRPDWLGVAGVARDLAATGLGKLKDLSVSPVKGSFPCPVEIKVDGDACPVFAGRLIRGVKNGPSPAWLQQKLASVGLRPINALVDVTNFLTHDRARPLHVYDAAKLTGGFVEARLGRDGEKVEALDGETYEVRFLYNPETEGFVSLRDLEDNDILPPSEVENWERRLEMTIPKPSSSH